MVRCKRALQLANHSSLNLPRQVAKGLTMRATLPHGHSALAEGPSEPLCGLWVALGGLSGTSLAPQTAWPGCLGGLLKKGPSRPLGANMGAIGAQAEESMEGPPVGPRACPRSHPKEPLQESPRNRPNSHPESPQESPSAPKSRPESRQELPEAPPRAATIAPAAAKSARRAAGSHHERIKNQPKAPPRATKRMPKPP